jgi:hypothetical protein
MYMKQINKKTNNDLKSNLMRLKGQHNTPQQIGFMIE